MIDEHRQLIGLVGATACFALAYRLWVAYKAEVLRQRVYRMFR